MDDELKKYREGLISTQRNLNESYDKLLITLSGGALALSITFLKDIIDINNIVSPLLLLGAWALFITSLAAILGEILFGIEAHKKAVEQIDDGTIYDEKVGGGFSYLTGLLHKFAAISLLVGLILISIFVYLNLGEENVKEATSTEASTQANTTPGTQSGTTFKGRFPREARGMATTSTAQETK